MVVTNIEQHLKERHLDCKKNQLFLNKTKCIATFPIFNLIGQWIGYHQYNPNGTKKIHNIKESSKYFTYVTEGHRYASFWGIHTLQYKNDILFITEGLFDVIRLHNANQPALAIFSNDPSKALKAYIKALGKLTISILDNDQSNAGRKLAAIGDKWYLVPDPYKDLGEMPDSEVQKFVNDIYKDVYAKHHSPAWPGNGV